MKDFKTRFLKELNDAPVSNELPPVNEPGSDAEAFGQRLDPETNPDDFEISDQKAQVSVLQSQERAGQLGEIMNWIDRINDTVAFLNGLDDDSIQSKISRADCDTLFSKVSQAETNKIGRIAQELAALGQSFSVYVNSNDEGAPGNQ